MNYQEFKQKLLQDLQNDAVDVQSDNHGQLIVYTGYYYQVSEGNEEDVIQETPDPRFEANEMANLGLKT